MCFVHVVLALLERFRIQVVYEVSTTIVAYAGVKRVAVLRRPFFLQFLILVSSKQDRDLVILIPVRDVNLSVRRQNRLQN